MFKVLSEEAPIKVSNQWLTCKAVLVRSVGGRRVEYLDNAGYVVKSEPFSRSQFRNVKFDEDKG